MRIPPNNRINNQEQNQGFNPIPIALIKDKVLPCLDLKSQIALRQTNSIYKEMIPLREMIPQTSFTNRRNLASNPNLPRQAMNVLAIDRDSVVRHLLSINTARSVPNYLRNQFR